MYTAKSGIRYRKIPEGYDVELWDKMTPIERMKVLGVLIEKEGLQKITNIPTKKYFHELSDKDIAKLLSKKRTWKYIMENYKQPSWCTYPEALSGIMGCWSLTDISKNRVKITDNYCNSCEYHDKFK